MDSLELHSFQPSGCVKANLHNVHETLLLPLWCRAKAAELSSDKFNDFQAIQMVHRIDYNFSRFHAKIRKFFIVMLAARAKEQDGIIRRFLLEHPHATIVNIGAGLDTTFYRVNNGTVQWYDLDVYDVIDLRKTLLRQDPQIHYIARSMFEPDFLEEIAPPEDGILFLISGVLMYFKEPDIRLFLKRIADRFPGCEIAFDTLTPFGVSIANRIIRKSGISNARIQWGISSVNNIKKWDSRFLVKEQKPVCYSVFPYRRFGFLSCALILLNRLFHVYTLNWIQYNAEGTPL